jgi:hypothetical protein
MYTQHSIHKYFFPAFVTPYSVYCRYKNKLISVKTFIVWGKNYVFQPRKNCNISFESKKLH